MTELRVNGVPHRPVFGSQADGLTTDRLRTIVQDSHLNFLIGAGTPCAFFGLLGNIEEALTELVDAEASAEAKAIVRASIQAYFFEEVLAPNLKVIERTAETETVLTSYARFLRTLNRILLKRHSSVLAKQANIFTTNVDMLFEVAFEQMGIDFSDGFSGKIRPRFDLGDFNTLRFRMASRFEQRSEVPVFNLVKLHGSAGWLQVERSPTKVEIFFDHGLSLVSDTQTALAAAKRDLISITEPEEVEVSALLARVPDEAVPDSVTAFRAAYDRLGIVNPDKQKFATTVLNETYYELIRRLANELEKENSVLFVHGFSFRDEHLRDVVVRAARANPTLLVIVFCYSRNGLADYHELIREHDIKNGNIQIVAPSEPADGDERKATLDVVTDDYFAPIVADKFPEPDQRIELDIRIPNEEGADV
ncbi:SIR2 family protein [Mycobacterium interjectum]|uniref:SIR2 family protein n=1 Tax=Mycobacterium interjectum TaxID=33895 RepID=UPI0009FD619F|nr:SIR2 family protein [Mycobacterium interjectum]MCV7092675.1 SIR2 family protein [Mycobacterium interjectum]